jgi:arylesterase/paraoxonase
MKRHIWRISIILTVLTVSISITYGDGGSELAAYERFEPVPGPEDMDFDRRHNRLIISSHDRRNLEKPGNMYTLDPLTGELNILKRENEPAGFVFHPHGISIVQKGTGEVLLYVIVHGKETDTGTAHSIAVYEVYADALYLAELLEDRLLESPNDLAAYPDGRIYVSNDKSRDGGMFELLFGLKKSSVVFYDGKGTWTRAATKIAMANGMAVDGNRVYVAATRDNSVFAYTAAPDGMLTDKQRIAKVKGADNFYLHDNELYIASHEKMFKLMAHFSKPEKYSPSLLFRIDLANNDIERVFYNEGELISAVSVGVPYGDALYLGQIFDSFVLKVALQ